MSWGVDDSALAMMSWGVDDSALAMMDDSIPSMVLFLDHNLDWFQRFIPTITMSLSIRATNLIFL
jgi:hypothetical protein